jgi:hypothetical protein
VRGAAAAAAAVAAAAAAAAAVIITDIPTSLMTRCLLWPFDRVARCLINYFVFILNFVLQVESL